MLGFRANGYDLKPEANSVLNGEVRSDVSIEQPIQFKIEYQISLNQL
ncbi:hypothetical protein [Leptospira weilii]|nr:hypothetical protein [Leptospira weilii]